MVAPGTRDLSGRALTEPAYSVVFGFQLESRRGYVVARVSLDDDRGRLAQNDDGTFPVFPSEADARGWAARTFPLPSQSPGDEIPMADLVRGTEELYATAGAVLHDLDIVRRWLDDPAGRAAEPRQVLEAWVFLNLAGLAPPVDLSDMEGYPDARAMAGLARFLSMMMHERERRPGASAWPDGVWGKEEDEFLISLLRPALVAFSGRLASVILDR